MDNKYHFRPLTISLFALILLALPVTGQEAVEEKFCQTFSQILTLVESGEMGMLRGKERQSIQRREDGSDGDLRYRPLIPFEREYSNHLYKPELKLKRSGGRATLDYYFDATISQAEAMKVLESYESTILDCLSDGWSSQRFYEYSFPYIEFKNQDHRQISISIILMDNMDFSNPRYMINLQYNFTTAQQKSEN